MKQCKQQWREQHGSTPECVPVPASLSRLNESRNPGRRQQKEYRRHDQGWCAADENGFRRKTGQLMMESITQQDEPAAYHPQEGQRSD